MAKEEPAKAADPVLAGIDRLRDTAKWLIGAYAAVGTALLAGLQLTSLGTVEDDVRLGVAIVTAAAALLAVLIGIAKVTPVLAPVQVEPSDLAPGSVVDQMVQATPTLLKGQAPDLASLKAEYATALTTYQDKRIQARTDATKEPEADRAFRHLMAVHAPLEHLRKMALFDKVQKKFKTAKRWLGGISVVAAGCVIAFAWAANPTDKDQATAKAKEGGPTLLNPSASTLSLESGRTSLAPLRERIGEDCNLERVAALVVGGTAAEPEVITLPTGRCKAVRFTVSDDIGITLPAKKAAVPKPK